MISRKGSVMHILEPQDRLEILMKYSTAVEVDPTVSINKYYGSGDEMIRIATKYFNESNSETAYVSYMKYVILFTEKIKKHPGYSQVPTGVKAAISNNLRIILPRTKILKSGLLNQYQKEYDAFMKETVRREKEAKRIRRERQEQESLRALRHEIGSHTDSWLDNPNIAIATSSDPVKYPDDETTASESTNVTSCPTITAYPKYHMLSQPSIDHSTKPSSLFSSTKSGIRLARMPTSIITRFLMVAKKNTMRNIVTCGIIAGHSEKFYLCATHLIIPKQLNSYDVCTMLNKNEILDYQTNHNLITIGWIQVHPSQPAFLSCVDLHMHAEFQSELPEATAIVCAPKYNDVAFFMLTPDYGIDFILHCKKTGFHPHPTNPPLYTVAEHVKLDPTASLEVMDFQGLSTKC